MTCDEAIKSEWTCGITVKGYSTLTVIDMIKDFCADQEIDVDVEGESEDFFFKTKYARDRVTKFIKEKLVEEFEEVVE